MRVLLVAPPFYRTMDFYTRAFPTGLVALATVLKHYGHDVLVYNADHALTYKNMDYSTLPQHYPTYLATLKNDAHPILQEMREVIRDFQPDVVGITVMTHFIASAFKTAQIAKQLDPRMMVVMGGPHCTLQADEVLDCPDVDYVFRGESEVSFRNFVDTLAAGGEVDGLPGISYRRDGRTIDNRAAGFIEDLDEIPILDRSLLKDHLSYPAEDMGLLMTGRGCPYKCAFCATVIWERKTRYHSIDHVVEEIQRIKATYGTKQFSIKDDSFVLNKKRIAEFCNRLVAEKLDINWSCNCNMNVLTPEILQTMRTAGCNAISVGVESGSERILKLMEKKIDRKLVLATSKMLNDSGIFWSAYFMMGVPTETREDVLQSIEFMKEIKPHYVAFAVYEIFPGTPFFRLGVETGVSKERMTVDEYFNTLPHNYYFVGGYRHNDAMTQEEFHEVEAFWRAECGRYNRQFSLLLRRGLSRYKMYFAKPSEMFADVVKLLRWYRAVPAK